MSDDIVKSLREMNRHTCEIAANEIERLRAENAAQSGLLATAARELVRREPSPVQELVEAGWVFGCDGMWITGTVGGRTVYLLDQLDFADDLDLSEQQIHATGQAIAALLNGKGGA